MFPEIRRRFSELLILFTDNKDKSQKLEDTVREIVKAQKFSNISMNMMHVPDESSVGFRVLQEYMEEPEIPHLSFVRFQKGEVFNFDAVDADMASLSNWLSNIHKGAVQPSTSLHEEEWKPRNKGFEYLKIIEWEKRNPAQVGFKPDDTPVDAVEDNETDETEDEADDSSSNDETEHLKGYHHHVFRGRSSHLPVHSHRMKKGDHSEENIQKKEGVMEHENQETSSDKSHEHTEL
ncbi:uncharacterized protein LOC132726783 [Ruditapes philippinarum]|uniref:uncharacterized protein LOC132726783 n=1 Tax=Ruditapes philippinarum TaxID=129788 RepID=UPI00295ABAB2|nr:uncharacterized protein LOC132726783 [Ruditapes philippinarum]